MLSQPDLIAPPGDPAKCLILATCCLGGTEPEQAGFEVGNNNVFGQQPDLARMAARLAETLKIGMASDVTSMDPHFSYYQPNNMISYHVFDTLTWKDRDNKLVSRLATEWKNITDEEWEIKLRDGVKWHDGTAFTADDVVFSLGRLSKVEGGGGGFVSLVNTITEVKKIDPLTLRLTTSKPTPSLMYALALIPIVPAANDGRNTADYNSGAAMMGTGPFEFVSYTPGAEIKLKANEHWWGGEVSWSDVTFRIVPEAAVRSTALLSGDLDVIENPAAADVERITREGFDVGEVPGLRLGYVNLIRDVADEGQKITDANGKTIEPSPLKDPRVREALSLAINRDGLVDRILLGAGAVTNQMLPSGVIGYVPDLPKAPYDVERAKALMVEAGFPDGFNLPFITAGDRVPANVDAAQALAQMWQRIGIKTTVNGVPTSVYIRLASNQQIPAYLGNLGNQGGVDITFNITFRTYNAELGTGAYNWGRYSNPKFDDLMERASTTMDLAEQEKLLQEATRFLIAEDKAILPLYLFKNVWAFRKDLELEPRVDALTTAWLIHPKAN